MLSFLPVISKFLWGGGGGGGGGGGDDREEWDMKTLPPPFWT